MPRCDAQGAPLHSHKSTNFGDISSTIRDKERVCQGMCDEIYGMVTDILPRVRSIMLVDAAWSNFPSECFDPHAC